MVTEPTITLKMIIDAGILKPNSVVYSSLNKHITGTLNADGSLSILINKEIKTFPFCSGAARAVEDRSLNGWIYWLIEDEDELKPLDYYRTKYKEKKNESS